MAVTVYPDPGRESSVAAQLLALADHPSQVATTTRPQPGGASKIGFVVSDELFAKFSGEQPSSEPKKRRTRKSEQEGE